MKPTKNRYFCKACRRRKMLFGSETEALNFIKFNKDAFTSRAGHVPVRTYYCNICLGWHVTSNPDTQAFESYISEAELAYEAYRRSIRRGNITPEQILIQKANDGKYLEAARLSLLLVKPKHNCPENLKYLCTAIEMVEEALKHLSGKAIRNVEEDIKIIRKLLLLVQQYYGSDLNDTQKEIFYPRFLELLQRYYEGKRQIKEYKIKIQTINERLNSLRNLIDNEQKEQVLPALRSVTKSIRRFITKEGMSQDAVDMMNNLLESRDMYVKKYEPSLL